jgi:hypothetical protein
MSNGSCYFCDRMSHPGDSSLVPHVGFDPPASGTAVAVNFGHASLVFITFVSTNLI